MRWLFTISLLLVGATCTRGQEEEELLEEQPWENHMALQEETIEDDGWWQQLEYYRKHPLSINDATEATLGSLHLLSDWQISQLLRYRELLGRLVNQYELQAVPGWDLATIRKVLPFIVVRQRSTLPEAGWQRLRGGEQSLLFRFANRQLDTTTDKRYAGSPAHFLFRYRYNYKNLLQYGITGEKDAGEQFFKGTQQAGFDFYSFHVFARQVGALQSLALGDFTVNLGQGLVHWQSLAFKKSSMVLSVKRQGPVLKPYNSTGEFNFHRGVGVTLQKRNWECTLFASLRKLSANLVADSLANDEVAVASLLPSGYHRTAAELNHRNNLQQLTTGGNIKYQQPHWQIGFNAVRYQFSEPFQSPNKPYDQFTFTGNQLSNYSIDHSATFRNLHWYGELAIDQDLHPAIIQGLLVSLHAKAALAIVYRQIGKSYQSLAGNAFTENRMPVNENGLYAGLTLRPAPGWQLDAYADVFRFPWLQYRADAPAYGTDYLVQVAYKPNRQAAFYFRYRAEKKMMNLPGMAFPGKWVLPALRQNWRMQYTFRVNNKLSMGQRVELVWYHHNTEQRKETGFSGFVDLSYRLAPALSADLRWHYFDTDSYDTRIYAYERDMLYSFSIPAVFDKGNRYYIRLRYDAFHHVFPRRIKKYSAVIWLRVAGFLPTGQPAGTGTPQRQSADFRMQLLLQSK